MKEIDGLERRRSLLLIPAKHTRWFAECDDVGDGGFGSAGAMTDARVTSGAAAAAWCAV